MERDPAILQRVPIFGGLTPGTLDFLLSVAATTEVPAGEPFFRQGEHGDAFFLLEAGQVEIIKEASDGRALRIRTLEAGDCFGEMALLAVMPRSATVRAVTDCTAVRITSGDLFRLYERDLAQFTMLTMNLGREVCRRLHATDELLFRLAPDAAAAEGETPK
jgi:CRP-like cAMP-binding protein